MPCTELESPRSLQCTDGSAVTALGFTITGGNCASSDNNNDQFTCVDSNGSPTSQIQYYIEFEFSGAVFGGPVILGEQVLLPVPFGDVMDIRVFTVNGRQPGTLLQQMTMGTTCTEASDLKLGNTFGAIELEEFRSDSSGTKGLVTRVQFTYIVENLSGSPVSLNSAVSDGLLAGRQTYVDDPVEISPDAIVSFEGDELTLNLLEAPDTVFFFSYNVATTLSGGQQCGDSALFGVPFPATPP